MFVECLVPFYEVLISLLKQGTFVILGFCITWQLTYFYVNFKWKGTLSTKWCVCVTDQNGKDWCGASFPQEELLSLLHYRATLGLHQGGAIWGCLDKVRWAFLILFGQSKNFISPLLEKQSIKQTKYPKPKNIPQMIGISIISAWENKVT